MGIFTIKAVIRASHQIFGSWVEMGAWVNIMFRDPRDWFRNMIPRRRGNEAQMVYIIMYIDAWRRSGWYPHFRIRNKVGISDASNEM